MLNATFESGDPPPRWVLMDVIAVRGERTAVLAFRIDYGNDTYIDTIDVVQLAEDLHRLHRIVEFDPKVPDCAIHFGVSEQELDRPKVAGLTIDKRGLCPA